MQLNLILEIFLACYIIGSIPIGHLVSKAFLQTDIKTVGSGNIGATNIYRIAGWKYAIPVFVLDFLKGMVPVLFVMMRYSDYTQYAVIAVIIGNIFSVFLNFKGGKGVATSTGALFVLVPFHILSGALLFVVMLRITKIVSLSSIIAFVVVTLRVVIQEPTKTSLPVIAATLLIIVAHRSNIQRIIDNKEKPITRLKPKKKK